MVRNVTPTVLTEAASSPNSTAPVVLALFDFDGTITEVDTFSRFVRFATPRVRLRLGTLGLLPVVLGYRIGWISGPLLRAMISRIAFMGTDASNLEALGAEFAQETIPSLVRSNAKERLNWHRSQGHRVIVVSASLDVYLRHWCEEENLELLCTRLEQKNGKMTGRYVAGDCSGEEKRRRILTYLDLGAHDEIYAYGDTAEDEPMLKLATRPYYRWRERPQ